ncbi:MAG: lytic transglycosylase domain-containing protein [Pikeienuella sp.]
MLRAAFLASFLAVSGGLAPPVLAPTAHAYDQIAAAQVQSMMDSADRKDWGAVLNSMSLTGDAAARDLGMWRILSAGEGTWRDYRDFVARNPDWPNLGQIRTKGEQAMPNGLSLADIDAFTDGVIRTGTGALRRAAALVQAGRHAEADEEIAKAWRTLSLTAAEQALFRANHSGAIRPYHQERADNLMWRGLTGEAQAMKPLLSPGWAALIEARVRLRRRANGVDAAIKAVPASLASHPSLAYERFLWRMRKNRYDGALDIIQANTGSAVDLGRPEEWGNRRRLLARRLLREGRHIEAYNLANQNQMTEGSDYADLEWFAGWVALRRMNEPDRAIAHFSRFLAAVGTPISYGRGYYWMGRAHEAKGDATARDWYARAAEHQTSFYGQIAAKKIGAPVSPYFSAPPDGDWRSTRFAGRTVTDAARLLSAAGDRRRGHWFLTHLADIAQGYDEFAGVADLALELGRPDAGIRIAKKAARKGHLLNGHYYPVSGLAQLNAGVEPALAMAIARQESELNPDAISHAGARGLMQLMPGTARKVTKQLGLPYSKARLTDDWQYNATLGQAYLAEQMADFTGSVALSAAAYNAGPHRSNTWIGRYGDPRTPTVDWIDWMEMIPFRETRNYAQRVIEGLQIYRNRISQSPVPFRNEQDARGY